MKSIFSYFQFLLLVIFFTACVGTVEDKSQQIQQTKDYNNVNFSFDGVVSGKAVAHNKVRLAFRPAVGGSGTFNYLVYVNGNKVLPATSVSGSSAQIDSNGFIHAVVSNLNKGTTYTFVVNAQDTSSGATDKNNHEIQVTTLNYEVPLFDGVVSLENVAGENGKTQLLVSWNKASPSSIDPNNFFGTDPNAISGYNVYVGQSEATLALWGSVNDKNAQSYLITGLTEGTNYFVRVRAKNSSSPIVEDLNEEYKEKKTKTSQPISFDGLQLAQVPKNTFGFTSIDLTWNAGSGDYDRYRIFVSSNETSAFDPAVDTPFGADITALSTTSITVTPFTPHTIYYVAVVACNNSACTSYKGHDVVKAVRTTPPIAPFNGIKVITQPSGADGLTQLVLTWDAPDTSYGVYDTIKVFKVDVNGTRTELPYYNDATPSVIGKDLVQTSSTGTVIKGLVSDTEYCFIVKAYSTTPADPQNASGFTHINENKVCATPKMTLPGFSGANTTCSSITGTSFTVNWATPSPLGIFSYYEIYYKLGSSGFNFTNATTGDPDYTKLTAASSSTSKTITGLSPNTTYQIGIKTYFQLPIAPFTVYRDNNLVVATCATSMSKLIHKGWEDIVAIGPKIDGLTGTKKMERIMLPGESGFIHRIPIEDSLAVQDFTGSKEGIVRFMWEDMELDGLSQTLYNFKDQPDTGYNIYRKAYDPSHDSSPPQISDSDWGNPLNGTVIPPQRYLQPWTGNSYYYGEYVDYSVQQSTTDADEAKIYWYKIEGVLNGVKVAYKTIPADGVVKVVLPPKNMALVHRWMANKQICGELNRTVDKTANYRCLFNGVGSKDGYYDFGGHLLIDRFELGVNFTRGNDPDTGKRCALKPGATNGPSFNWEGSATDALKGIIQGDCIGATGYPGPPSNASVPNQIWAKNNAVYYIRDVSHYPVLINRIAGTGVGANWVSYTDNIFEAEATPLYNSIVVPYTDDTPLGQGIGGIVSSNNANLPPMQRISQSMMYKTCMNHKVVLKGRTYYKRTPRRREQVVAFAHPSSKVLDPSTATKIADDNYTHASSQGDCHSTYHASYRGYGISPLDFNDGRYAQRSAQYVVYATGSTYTKNCLSRFGIQDHIGAQAEWSSDRFFCHRTNVGLTSNGSTNGRCSAMYSDLATGLDPVVPFTKLWDPNNTQYWRNGDGKYFMFEPPTYNPFGFDPSNSSQQSFSATNNNYINVVMGVPLQCVGSACQAATDDNVLVTTKSSTLVTNPNTSVFNFSVEGDASSSVLYSTSAAYNSNGWGFIGGGPWTSCVGSTCASNGRYYLSMVGITSYNSGAYHSYVNGGRCAIMLDEDNSGLFVDENGAPIHSGTNNMSEHY